MKLIMENWRNYSKEVLQESKKQIIDKEVEEFDIADYYIKLMESIHAYNKIFNKQILMYLSYPDQLRKQTFDMLGDIIHHAVKCAMDPILPDILTPRIKCGDENLPGSLQSDTGKAIWKKIGKFIWSKIKEKVATFWIPGYGQYKLIRLLDKLETAHYASKRRAKELAPQPHRFKKTKIRGLAGIPS
jgi:hypothetical protein